MKPILLSLATVAVFALGCGQDEQPSSAKGTTLKTEPARASTGKDPIVLMETSLGDIKIELFPDKAPITVENFLNYANDKHYNGTIFHRVIPGFMAQGGGYEPGMREKPTRQPIKNESYNGELNKRGTLAMARTNAPDSATSQFFINVADNGFLNRAQARDGVGYCVFGRVIEGMDVVDRMVAVPKLPQGDHVPAKDIIIKSARVIKSEEK